MNTSMKLARQFIAIFINFSTTSNHLHPLQVENCDSNSRLVVDQDDNGKFRRWLISELKVFPVNKICLTNIGLILVQRRKSTGPAENDTTKVIIVTQKLAVPLYFRHSDLSDVTH